MDLKPGLAVTWSCVCRTANYYPDKCHCCRPKSAMQRFQILLFRWYLIKWVTTSFCAAILPVGCHWTTAAHPADRKR
jgi:hypothetical protein